VSASTNTKSKNSSSGVTRSSWRSVALTRGMRLEESVVLGLGVELALSVALTPPS
jgi:hypothetical protein